MPHLCLLTLFVGLKVANNENGITVGPLDCWCRIWVCYLTLILHNWENSGVLVTVCLTYNRQAKNTPWSQYHCLLGPSDTLDGNFQPYISGQGLVPTQRLEGTYQVRSERVEWHVVGVPWSSSSKVHEGTVPDLVVLQQDVVYLFQHGGLIFVLISLVVLRSCMCVSSFV